MEEEEMHHEQAWHRLGRLSVWIALALCASALARPQPSAASGVFVAGQAAGSVNVVAAENFYGDIVHQLGGSHVNVTSILSDPSADPHEYESDVGDAKADAGYRVAQTEPVAGYMMSALGISVDEGDFQHAIEEGNDPPAQLVASIQAQIKNKQVTALLYNLQTTSDVTDQLRQLAQQSGIPVVPVTETLPPNE